MITSKIGAHISIAGGIDKAPERAHAQGCETFQCFTRSPQGGRAPELTPDLVANFKQQMQHYDFDRFHIHAPYYINLASLDESTCQSSVRVIREELERGGILGAPFVMAHVGSHSGQTLEAGIAKVADGILRILDGYSGSTQFLMEIAAGTGQVIGDTFEEMASIIKLIEHHGKLPGFGGICFDTCHAFASGYDFRTAEGATQVLKHFDQTIGLEYLRLTHVNDSKTDLAGKRDRHEHIGQGFIGRDGLASLLTTEPFSRIDWLLETEENGREMDIQALKSIKARGRP